LQGVFAKFGVDLRYGIYALDIRSLLEWCSAELSMGACCSKGGQGLNLNPRSPQQRKWVKYARIESDPNDTYDRDLLMAALLSSEYLNGFTTRFLQHLVNTSTIREFTEMESLYKEGTDSDAFYCVKEGTVELTQVDGSSNALLNKGALFGVKDMAKKSMRSESAWARGLSTVVVRFTRHDYQFVLDKKRHIAELPTFKVLRQCALFLNVPDADLLTLHENCLLEKVQGGDKIFTKGETQFDKLFIVLSGTVLITDLFSDDAFQSALTGEWLGTHNYVTLGPKGYFGEETILGAATKDYEDVNTLNFSAKAGDLGCELLSLDRKSFEQNLFTLRHMMCLNIDARDAANRREGITSVTGVWQAKTGYANDFKSKNRKNINGGAAINVWEVDDENLNNSGQPQSDLPSSSKAFSGFLPFLFCNLDK